MRLFSLLLFALPMMLVPAASRAQVSVGVDLRQTPPAQEPERPLKQGTGRLRGRVTAADTGAAVRRAQVSISSADAGSKTTSTDTQGRYEFRNLPAGRFTVRASKSGFLETRYGQSHPSKRGRPIELAEGQVVDKVDVALPRGGAISGRILDEFGDPVPDATVAAMRMQYVGGERRLVSAGRTSTTTDLGTFRLFGLPPGEYYVSATAPHSDSPMGPVEPIGEGQAGSSRTGHAATYYPNTTNPADAQRIALTMAQEVSADIQLFPVRLAQITGNAVASDGKPMTHSMVMLIPTAMQDAFMAVAADTDKNGRFVLNGVAPGEYTVQVQSLAALMSAATQAMAMFGAEGKTAPPSPTASREFAMAKVTVAGEDINGLSITATRGARARGRVVFEHGQAPDDLTSLRLVAEARGAHNMPLDPAPAMAALKENGAFEMEGLAGPQAFELMDPPKGWFLKRVTHNGTDLTDEGYVFTPGEDVSGFEVVMTTRSQTVTGSVANARGEAVKNYTVIVFPEDESKWTGAPNRSFGTAGPDPEGRFQLSGLPAGSYLAVAVESEEDVEWTDPEWLARAAKIAARFTLDEGATTRVQLKLSEL